MLLSIHPRTHHIVILHIVFRNSSMTDVFGVAGTGIELIPPRQIMARIGYTF